MRHKPYTFVCFIMGLLCVSACTQNSKHQGMKESEQSSESIENNSEQDTSIQRIRFSFQGKEVYGILYDNPTTQSLVAQLPIEVNFSDYARAEKIAYLPTDLQTSDAPVGDDPKIGDISCYGPWGNFVIYYEDQPYATGIIPMGRIEIGLEYIREMSEATTVYIECL